MVQSRAGAPGLPADQLQLPRCLDAEGPAVAAAGWWDGAGSSAPLPVPHWFAVGLSGEHYWADWRGLWMLAVG